MRTRYRLLGAEDELRERRDVRRHPHYAKPELLATAPRQRWSWDITKLMGPVKWTSFYLDVIMDVFSRDGVGWMVATGKSAALATPVIRATCAKPGLRPGQLTRHAVRGPAGSPNRWPACSPTWGSSRPTADPTPAITTPSASPTSRP